MQARAGIYAGYKSNRQLAFLDVVLSPHLLLLELNAIADSTADLGTPDQIRQTFIGFQKYLYVQIDQA